LSTHVFDLFFIELNFHLALLKLTLLSHDLGVLFRQGRWNFGVAGLLYEIFKLTCQSFKFVLEVLVLLAQFGDDHVLAHATPFFKVHLRC